MAYRTLPLLLAALVLAVFVAGPALADEKVHETTVAKVADGKLVLTFKGDPKEDPHEVAKEAKITLDGKPAKLDDLKAGYPVKVAMTDKHVLTKIDAQSKK